MINQELALMRCYDTVKHVPEALAQSLPEGVEAWVVGGLAVSPLRAGMDTIFDADSSTIRVDHKSDLPVLRDSEPQNRRDLDVVVGGVLSSRQASRVRAALTDAVDNHMPVSVFDFKRSYPNNLSRTERVRQNMGRFISERTVDDEGRWWLEMFPLRVEIPKDAYQTWTMELPDKTQLPVMHPLATLVNYGGRSISGLRKKDVKKCMSVRESLLGHDNVPDALRTDYQNHFRIQFNTTFTPLREFNRAVSSLRRGGRLANIAEHLHHPDARLSDLNKARLRAVAIRTGERFPSVVSFFQQDGVQRAVRPFVGHK